MRRPKVVIIGGGFAGVAAAKRLDHSPCDIVVIDRHNHHVFQPLLYEVATGSLATSDIAVPIRWLLREQQHTRVVLGEVTGVDTARRVVQVDDGKFEEPYDYLIVAAGVRHGYFGHDDWESVAPGLKNLDDAIEIRDRFFGAFEHAEVAEDAAERDAFMTIAVIGGGPTGVELTGMIKTVCRTALRDDFRRIKPANARIILLEGGPRILPELSEHLSARATRDLQDLGVEVRTGARVTSVDAEGIWIGNERLACRTVLWAAGTRGSPIGRSLNVPLDKIGRVIVEPDLSVPGHPEIFVVGDQCYFPHVGTGRVIPAVAPAANQMGDAAAANILRTIWKQARKPFVYFDKGDLAVIGRYRAVAAFRGMEFTGLAAWFVWLFIHILYLASFRNRLSVMLQWGWAYATWQRGMRIILDRNAHDNIGKRKPEKALPAVTQ